MARGAALAVVPGGWSVSCEAAFYMALPFVLHVVNGHVWRAGASTGLAIVVAQLWARNLIRIAEWLVPGDDWRTLALHLAITMVASFGLACVTHRWIEQPAIRWAARLVRREKRLVRASG